MAQKPRSLKETLLREAVLFLWLLFAGILLLPVAIWIVGQGLFGDYSGSGFGGFYGDLNARLRLGDSVAWFLTLSPYLAIVILRLVALGWRKTRKPAT